MHIVFASHQDPGAWLPALREALPGHTITVWNPQAPPTGAEGAVVWQPPAELFEHERNLKILFNLGAGVDAILRMPQLPSGIRIARLEDAGMAVQIAEYAVYALLRIARGFGVYERDQAAGRWQPQPGLLRRLWPVGVLGLGSVGERVARVLAALDFPVAGWSRSRRAIEGVQCMAGADELPAFLARTRVLVNVLPLTDATRGILNRRTLSQLLPDACLINVGRGAHLVEQDLLDLLDEGRLAGAALDVFEHEPLPPGHRFWSDPRVHITPHIAGTTLRDEAVESVARQVGQYARGEPVSGIVERARGY
jgi:glyoxylate/hydroxypyruvate reductase A